MLEDQVSLDVIDTKNEKHVFMIKFIKQVTQICFCRTNASKVPRQINHNLPSEQNWDKLLDLQGVVPIRFYICSKGHKNLMCQTCYEIKSGTK